MVSRVVLPLGCLISRPHRLDQLSRVLSGRDRTAFLLCLPLFLGYLQGYLGLRPVTQPGRLLRALPGGHVPGGSLLMTLFSSSYAWEMMAASSYYLVLFEDERVGEPGAPPSSIWLLLMSAPSHLLSFGVMAGLATGLSGLPELYFDAMRETDLPRGSRRWPFPGLLRLLGKGGSHPLHVWLPEAHPVAPSNVSALMSA